MPRYSFPSASDYHPRIVKRFRRILFNALAAISILLAIATGATWVRSEWVFDHLGFSQPRWSLFMESEGGQFRFEWTRAMPWQTDLGGSGFYRHTDKADLRLRDGMRMPGSKAWIDRWGFWIVTGERWGDDHLAVFMPCWVLLLPAAMTISLAAHRWRRSVPQDGTGRCPSCGYDLRASPERCPECGDATPATGTGVVWQRGYRFRETSFR